MNCKQGDLAIVVRSEAGNEGKIVRCLELMITDTVIDLNGRPHWYANGVSPIWKVDRPMNFAKVGNGEISQAMFCADEVLRPIRGLDEVIEEEEEIAA